MTQPLKKGLTYFPLSTHLFDDRKIQRLLKKYGSDGITTYLATLCEIYATKGYYAEYSNNLCFDIGFKLQMGEIRVKNILKYCVTIQLFNGQLFNTEQVITSLGVQKRFAEVAKRAKYKVDMSAFSIQKEGVFSGKFAINPEKPPINEYKMNTKKEKQKSKLKNKKNDEHRHRSINGELERKAELDRMLLAATGK